MDKNWNQLETELMKLKEATIQIKYFLFSYENRCSQLILEIQNKSFNEAQLFFDELYEIQEKLATILYKYEFNLSTKLKDFVYYFERDDIFTRQYWYGKFKEGMTWPEE